MAYGPGLPIGMPSTVGILTWLGTAWDALTGGWHTVLDFLSTPFAGVFDWIATAWDALIASMAAKLPQWLGKLFGVDSVAAETTPSTPPPAAAEDEPGFFGGLANRLFGDRAETPPRDRNQDLYPQAIPGITGPLPVGPAPVGAGAAGGALAGAGGTWNITIGEINIDAHGADAREIGQNVRASLRDQLQQLTFKSDSEIER